MTDGDDWPTRHKASKVSRRGRADLERLCKSAPGRQAGGSDRDRIRIASGAAGIERLEAHLHGQAFSPHRHDTYAIGITLSGIQAFRFRGERWRCLPGQCHILHPDEMHDGGAGNDEGFTYRIVYVAPSLVQEAMQGRPLPFVPCPVVDVAVLDRSPSEVWRLEEELDDVARIELVDAVTNLLVGASPEGAAERGPLALSRLARVRDLIAAAPAERRSMAELERTAGLDRWTLARQFRAAFGTSPSRFRIMRQLDQVRRLLRNGASLTEAAGAAGFADQSHMTRHFKRAYGLTPGAWVSVIA
jgi:AraC-like DNA-binding protein